MDNHEQQLEEGKKQCKNCLQYISEANFTLHELRCAKHTVLCEVCGEPVSKEEIEQHLQEEHAPVECQHCGKKFPREQIDHHRDDTCPEFKINCKYCELEIPRKDHSEHVDGCGSRTDICEQCSQRVRLRDMYEHQQNKCGKMQALGVPALQSYPDMEGSGQGFFSPLGALFSSHDKPTYFTPFTVSPHKAGFVHPFVPLPVQPVISHAQPQPHPQEQPKSEDLHLDPQWLASVAGACGEENLDQVLAQNMMVEDYCRKSPPPSYSPPNRQTAVAADVEGDAGLAQRLQQAELDEQSRFALFDDVGFVGGTAGSKVGGDLGTSVDPATIEDRDAEMARLIHERDLAYVESQRRDKEFAERLQEEERQAGLLNRGHDGVYEPMSEDYQRQPLHGDATAAIPDAYHGQREDEDTAFDDSLLARRLQLEEEEGASVVGGAYGLEDGAAVVNDYDAGVLDDEQPRAKTPPYEAELQPDEGKIPCEYCNALYPFEEIYKHQLMCYHLRGAPTSPTYRDGPAHFLPQAVASRGRVDESSFQERREEHGFLPPPPNEEQRYRPPSPSADQQRHHLPPSVGFPSEQRYHPSSNPSREEPIHHLPPSVGFPSEQRYHPSSNPSKEEPRHHLPPSVGFPSEQRYHPSSNPSREEPRHHLPPSLGFPSEQRHYPSSNPSREEPRHHLPPSLEQRHYPSSREEQKILQPPHSKEEQKYNPPSNDRFPSSSRTGHHPANGRFHSEGEHQPPNDRFHSKGEHQPPNDRFHSKGEHQPPNDRFHSKGERQPSNDRLLLSKEEHRYHPPPNEGFHSREEQMYTPPSNDRFPSTSRVREQQKYRPSSNEVLPTREDTPPLVPSTSRVREEQRYRPLSNERLPSREDTPPLVPSTSRVREQKKYRPSSNAVLPSKNGASRENVSLAPYRDREEAGGLVLTDDVLRQLSSKSNQESVTPPLTRPHISRAPQANTVEDDLVPCEVCGKMFAFMELVKHEATCGYQPSRKSQSAMKHVPGIAAAVSGKGKVKGVDSRHREEVFASRREGGNSRKEELSVEGHKMGRVSKPVHSSGQFSTSGSDVAKKTTAQQRGGQTQHKPASYRFRETFNTEPRAPDGLGQNSVPASNSMGTASKGRNEFTRKAELPSSGRSFESTRAPEWRVEGMKMATKDSRSRHPDNTGPWKSHFSSSLDGD